LQSQILLKVVEAQVNLIMAPLSTQADPL
jgi:hypothetical protein